MILNNTIAILLFILILLLVGFFILVVKRLYILGYTRAKTLIKKNKALILSQINVENKEKLNESKNVVFDNIAKPIVVDKALLNIKKIEEELAKLKEEKVFALDKIENRYKLELDELKEKNQASIASIKQSNAIDTNKQELVSQLKKLEDDIKQKKIELQTEIKKYDELNKGYQIQCKSKKIFKVASDSLKRIISPVSKDFIYFFPIIIFIFFVIVDYFVGMDFIELQYESKLGDVAIGSDSYNRIKAITYSLSFMVFGGAMLAIEFARKKIFDVYDNLIVNTIKWLSVILFAIFGFVGLILFFGGTRFFAGDEIIQKSLQDIGLLGIWFMIVFICSLLLQEIVESKRKFSPIVTMFSLVFVAPIILLFTIFSFLIYILEYIGKFIFSSKEGQSESKKLLDRELEELNSYYNNISDRIKGQLSIKELLHSEEEEYISKRRRTNDSLKEEKNIVNNNFYEQHDKLFLPLDKLKDTVKKFREGSDNAVVNYLKLD